LTLGKEIWPELVGFIHSDAVEGLFAGVGCGIREGELKGFVGEDEALGAGVQVC
jgi:hypothetical protein